jgi:hypothetical protein
MFAVSPLLNALIHTSKEPARSNAAESGADAGADEENFRR